MLNLMIEALNRWNVTKTERQKLQDFYVILAIVITLVGGIISLFNVKIGHQVVLIALAVILTFLINAVIWNLLQASLLQKLSSKAKRK